MPVSGKRVLFGSLSMNVAFPNIPAQLVDVGAILARLGGRGD